MGNEQLVSQGSDQITIADPQVDIVTGGFDVATSMILALEFLASQDYLDGLRVKNLPESLILQTEELVDNPKALLMRSEELFNQAFDALREFYRESEGPILIPYSGGRDSSSIFALTLLLNSLEFDNSRRIILVTALTGFAGNLQAPREQAEKIVEQIRSLGIQTNIDLNTDHYYMDLSGPYSEHVVRSSLEDRDKLGHPGLCSSCKITMEAHLAQAAKQLGAGAVALGYTDLQAMQQWPEQSEAQQAEMQTWFRDNYPGIVIGSPLNHVITLPPDTTLLLAALGLPTDHHKQEMPCAAARTNPISMDHQNHAGFVRGKLKKMYPGEISLSTEIPKRTDVDHAAVIMSLKQDSNFMSGVFPQ
ncbi:hypothetical protein GYA49_02075 [Candidatus Beckwithbacteria bacterium]|nr:hypothetical protein [Candidatus Beckwithbacteria bacterium]